MHTFCKGRGAPGCENWAKEQDGEDLEETELIEEEKNEHK
jgi:hypothetical protein